MPNFKVDRLKIPTFDLSWVKYRDVAYVLLSGGGGSAKSGVKNQILVERHNGGHKFELSNGFFTDEGARLGLCSGVTVGTLKDGTPVVCAIVESACVLLELTGSEISFVKKCDFIADLAPQESSVNCARILSTGIIATGGEDFICRLWNLTIKKGTDEWKVVLHGELAGHTAPIMSITNHPKENWICSSSKDGTCKIWDTATCSLLANIPHHSDGIAELQPVGNKPVNVECRGSCFSPCGLFLYSIQSPRRGKTFLIKWVIAKTVTSSKSSPGTALSAYPLEVVAASKVPSTRLAINESGSLLAVGASDGNVHIYHSATMKKVKSFAQHDLPITGLGFAPSIGSSKSNSKKRDGLLVSCSADNKMVSMEVKESLLSSFTNRELLGILLTLILILIAMNYQRMSAK